MDRSIARRLNALNARLYDELAAEFSRSRARLQPGIERALASLAPFDLLLDVGCGDGRVGRALRSGVLASPLDRWHGEWIGVDRSESLLFLLPAPGGEREIRVAADLIEPTWVEALPAGARGVDALVCFSVLHHVPGAARRQALMEELASLLRPGGRFAVSVWQLLHRERFRRRLLPWSTIGLDESDLEPGDLLLDWKRGAEALRYVHHFEPAELRAMCTRAGLEVDEEFRSDGDSADLGLYLTGHRPVGPRRLA